jgi:hypothetical protein
MTDSCEPDMLRIKALFDAIDTEGRGSIEKHLLVDRLHGLSHHNIMPHSIFSLSSVGISNKNLD